MIDIMCVVMDRSRKGDAFQLLNKFLREDKFYLASSVAYGDAGPQALDHALDLFLAHRENGFVWLAYFNGSPAAVCVVCYAISTSRGARVAKLDDVFVRPERQRQGVATGMIAALVAKLRDEGITRIDTAVEVDNRAASNFYGKLGFQNLREERLALLLRE